MDKEVSSNLLFQAHCNIRGQECTDLQFVHIFQHLWQIITFVTKADFETWLLSNRALPENFWTC